jgi:hypothetical protein
LTIERPEFVNFLSELCVSSCFVRAFWCWFVPSQEMKKPPILAAFSVT